MDSNSFDVSPFQSDGTPKLDQLAFNFDDFVPEVDKELQSKIDQLSNDWNSLKTTFD